VNIHTYFYKKVLILLVIVLFQVPAILSAQTLSLEQCIDTALIYNRNIKLSQHVHMVSMEQQVLAIPAATAFLISIQSDILALNYQFLCLGAQ